jgi:hypothetical protein
MGKIINALVVGSVLGLIAGLSTTSLRADVPLNENFSGDELSRAEKRSTVVSIELGLELVKALLGKQISPVIWDPVKIELSGMAIESVKSEINAKLKDPYSAQYSELSAVTFPDSERHEILLVCGNVNAKNSFGAFVGKTPFLILMLNPHLAEKIMNVEFDSAGVREMCKAEGMLL